MSFSTLPNDVKNSRRQILSQFHTSSVANLKRVTGLPDRFYIHQKFDDFVQQFLSYFCEII